MCSNKILKILEVLGVVDLATKLSTWAAGTFFSSLYNKKKNISIQSPAALVLRLMTIEYKSKGNNSLKQRKNLKKQISPDELRFILNVGV